MTAAERPEPPLPDPEYRTRHSATPLFMVLLVCVVAIVLIAVVKL